MNLHMSCYLALYQACQSQLLIYLHNESEWNIRNAREEMVTLVAAQRISRSLSSKLPPPTKHTVVLNDILRVYMERIKPWERPFWVHRTVGKHTWVSEKAEKVKQFNLMELLPEPKASDDQALPLEHEGLRSSRLSNATLISARGISTVEAVFNITETLHPDDPRGRSGMFDQAKDEELKGLLQRGAFQLVRRADVPAGAKVLSWRFVLAIKLVDTDKHLYKARFVEQGHPDRDKHIMLHNSSTARPASVRLVVSIAATRGYSLWSFDFTQA